MPSTIQRLENLKGKIGVVTFEELVYQALGILRINNPKERRLTGGMSKEGDAAWFASTSKMYLPVNGKAAKMFGQSSAIILIDGYRFMFQGNCGFRLLINSLTRCDELEEGSPDIARAFNNWIDWLVANIKMFV